VPRIQSIDSILHGVEGIKGQFFCRCANTPHFRVGLLEGGRWRPGIHLFRPAILKRVVRAIRALCLRRGVGISLLAVVTPVVIWATSVQFLASQTLALRFGFGLNLGGPIHGLLLVVDSLTLPTGRAVIEHI
jgi:hypothetical protein